MWTYVGRITPRTESSHRKKLGPGRTQMSLLDFFLVSDTLLEVIKGETILPDYRSNHSIITKKLCFDKNERDRGFWKFNYSLLKDPTFIQNVKDALLKVKRQYDPIPYNRDVSRWIEVFLMFFFDSVSFPHLPVLVAAFPL